MYCVGAQNQLGVYIPSVVGVLDGDEIRESVGVGWDRSCLLLAEVFIWFIINFIFNILPCLRGAYYTGDEDLPSRSPDLPATSTEFSFILGSSCILSSVNLREESPPCMLSTSWHHAAFPDCTGATSVRLTVFVDSIDWHRLQCEKTRQAGSHR